MRYITRLIFIVGRMHGRFVSRRRKYSAVMHYIARGLHFILTGVFPDEIIRKRIDFSHARTLDNHNNNIPVNSKNDLDLSEIRKYIDKDYWEQGAATGKGSYDGIHSLVGVANSVGLQFTNVLRLHGKKMLDLGCASGQTVKAFREQGVEAYGIDLSDYAVEAGIQAFDLRNIIWQGSIHDLSRWARDEFDFLYSNQVLEHLPEQYVPEFVKECFRVLKPGGSIWIGLVLSLSPDPEGIRAANDPDATHINLHYRSWWNERFLAGGFVLDEKSLEAVEGTPIWFEFGWHHLAYQKPASSA